MTDTKNYEGHQLKLNDDLSITGLPYSLLKELNWDTNDKIFVAEYDQIYKTITMGKKLHGDEAVKSLEKIREDLNSNEKYEELLEVRNAGHISNVTYDMIQWLGKNKANEEMINAITILHNMMVVPLETDFEKTHKFVAGWVRK